MDKKRILIVEASQTFAGILLEFLKEGGYEAELAVNGFEGIKKVYGFLPELIVIDAETPLIQGYQFTRLLKSRPATKKIPVIIFTAQEDSKDKFWGKQAGADLYIGKSPENFEEMSKHIERLLNETAPLDFA
jgi:DNA-binding response OmpR family regulator